jgi:hypothetical protein
MPIDREQLLADLKVWLLPENPLTDEQIMVIAELIISRIGDDEIYYGEVFCKTLELLARRVITILSGSTTSGNKRREKTDEVEVEWYNSIGSALNGWNNLLSDLSNICPLYGYVPKKAYGLKIFPGKKFNPCGCDDKGDLI